MGRRHGRIIAADEAPRAAAPAGAPLGDLTTLLATGSLDPAAFDEVVDRHGVRADPEFRRQTLGLVLGYVERALEDGALTAEEQLDCRALRTVLRVRDGEFLAVSRAEVTRLLDRQLGCILADAGVDEAEDLFQVDLQAVFGLGYDECLALTWRAFERARACILAAAAGEGDVASAARAKLAALEPAYRLAEAAPVAARPAP